MALARRKSRYRSRPRNLDYLAFLRRQDCRVAVYLNTYQFCEGPMTAAHVGERPLGRKCPDEQSISLCFGHGVTDAHDFGRGRDGKRGFFAAMTAAQRRQWYDNEIAACWSMYLSSKGLL